MMYSKSDAEVIRDEITKHRKKEKDFREAYETHGYPSEDRKRYNHGLIADALESILDGSGDQESWQRKYHEAVTVMERAKNAVEKLTLQCSMSEDAANTLKNILG